MSCSHCPDAIHNTNRNDSAPLKKVERNDFRKCEQHETQSRRVKIKFKISESRDIIVIANALLGYYYQKFNAILQVNAIYFQRRKKLLTIINLMSNTRKTYKTNFKTFLDTSSSNKLAVGQILARQGN